jgi:hypothetical protein
VPEAKLFVSGSVLDSPLPVEPALNARRTAMSIARSLPALLLVATIGGCASVGARTRTPAKSEAATMSTADEIALLRLAGKVEEAALAHDVLEYGH